MSNKPVFGYWDIRGLAQPIRLLLAYVGEDYEDKRYECGPGPNFNKDCWLNEKFTLGLSFPNLPYYIDGDVKLTQSGAILRYLAHKHKLGPKTEAELIRLDILYEEVSDLKQNFVRTSYNPNFESLKDSFIVQAKNSLKQINEFFGSNSWCTGANISFTDFVLYETIDVIQLLDPTVLEECENLRAFHARFQALPAIKQYLESDRCIKRPINNKMATFL